MKKKDKTVVFDVEPKESPSGSSAAWFCKVYGVIVIIAGVGLAIMNGKSAAYGTYQQMDMGVFISTLLGFGFVGCFLIWGLAEVFQNIQSIADSLKGFKAYESPDAVYRVKVEGQIHTEEAVEEPVDEKAPIPIKATINASKAGEEQHVTPIQTEDADRIKCPICGTVQNKDRSTCFHCSAKFD